MIVFVGTYRLEDGTIENLPEGMHPYCEPCRRELQITDELNAGRDLRAEAKQAVIEAVEKAKAIAEETDGLDKGLGHLYDVVDTWAGGTDDLFAMLGRRRPERPPEVLEGVNDALKEIDPASMSSTLSCGVITSVCTLKDRLPAWEDFVQRTYEHYKTIHGDDKARRILTGFLK